MSNEPPMKFFDSEITEVVTWDHVLTEAEMMAILAYHAKPRKPWKYSGKHPLDRWEDD